MIGGERSLKRKFCIK